MAIGPNRRRNRTGTTKYLAHGTNLPKFDYADFRKKNIVYSLGVKINNDFGIDWQSCLDQTKRPLPKFMIPIHDGIDYPYSNENFNHLFKQDIARIREKFYSVITDCDLYLGVLGTMKKSFIIATDNEMAATFLLTTV